MVFPLSYLDSDLVDALRLSSFLGVAVYCLPLGVLYLSLLSGVLSLLIFVVEEVLSLLD